MVKKLPALAVPQNLSGWGGLKYVTSTVSDSQLFGLTIKLFLKQLVYFYLVYFAKRQHIYKKASKRALSCLTNCLK